MIGVPTSRMKGRAMYHGFQTPGSDRSTSVDMSQRPSAPHDPPKRGTVE